MGSVSMGYGSGFSISSANFKKSNLQVAKSAKLVSNPRKPQFGMPTAEPMTNAQRLNLAGAIYKKYTEHPHNDHDYAVQQAKLIHPEWTYEYYLQREVTSRRHRDYPSGSDSEHRQSRTS